MSFARPLLWPFAVPYGAGARLRAWSYRAGLARRQRLGGIVISVGNLTTGGTGKTPMVCAIAEHASREGKRVAILSRGYRGADGTSDEIEIFRRRLGISFLIGVGANRYANGKSLEAQGAEFFILDDGFQHLQLARDFDLVLLDASSPFGSGRLLPAGRLREPPSALRRADAILITRSDHAPAVQAVVRRHTQAPIFYAQTKLENLAAVATVPGQQMKIRDSVNWSGKKLFAFSGIGNPAAFLADLRRWGADVADQMAFRDHHVYSQRDIAEIERRAQNSRADALICTEKDVANLINACPNALPLFCCIISTQINDPTRFWSFMSSTISARRDRRPKQ